MQTPRQGGCYRQLPDGTLVPADQAPQAQTPETPPPSPVDWRLSIPDDDTTGPGFDIDQPQED